MVALRVNVQVANAGRLPPLNENVLAPATALIAPPQVPTPGFAGLAIIIPFGMLSVKAIPVSVTFSGLISWILIVEAEPPNTVNGLKPFTKSMDKVPTPLTVKLEVRLPAGTRFSLLVMFEGGIVFVCTPGVLLVTYTSILQRCPARIKPFVNEIEVAPVGAVKTRGGAAPQPVIVGAVELLTVTPVGRLSVIEKFVRFVLPGAKMSILNLELPPGAMEAGENDLAPITSVPLTVTFAFAGRKFVTP